MPRCSVLVASPSCQGLRVVRPSSFRWASKDGDARQGCLDGSEGSGGGGNLFLAGLLLLNSLTRLARVLDVLVADVALEADGTLAAAATEGGLGLASVLAFFSAGSRFAPVVVEGVGLRKLAGEGAHLLG